MITNCPDVDPFAVSVSVTVAPLAGSESIQSDLWHQMPSALVWYYVCNNPAFPERFIVICGSKCFQKYSRKRTALIWRYLPSPHKFLQHLYGRKSIRKITLWPQMPSEWLPVCEVFKAIFGDNLMLLKLNVGR